MHTAVIYWKLARGLGVTPTITGHALITGIALNIAMKDSHVALYPACALLLSAPPLIDKIWWPGMLGIMKRQP